MNYEKVPFSCPLLVTTCPPDILDVAPLQFGWLLSYWNLAGVPFSYAYPALYISTRDPRDLEFPTWVLVSLFVVLTIAHGL